MYGSHAIDIDGYADRRKTLHQESLEYRRIITVCRQMPSGLAGKLRIAA
jgi:hypothetical protein